MKHLIRALALSVAIVLLSLSLSHCDTGGPVTTISATNHTGKSIANVEVIAADGTFLANLGQINNNASSIFSEVKHLSLKGVVVQCIPATDCKPQTLNLEPNTQNSVFLVSAGPGVSVQNKTLQTNEGGGTDTFTVVLNAAPNSDVTIAISSSNTQEATVLPASLTFTAVNWNVAQTVTVTGVDDLATADGNKSYTIILATAVSSDSRYHGLDPNNVNGINIDNDTPGITVTPQNFTITEAAGANHSQTFTIVLNTQPSNDVTIGLSSNNTSGGGTVSLGSVIFTNVNWANPQTIIVTATDDALVDGSVIFKIITAAATSSDNNYNNLNPADVNVTATDDDVGGGW